MSNEFTPTTEQVEDGYVHDSRDEYRDPLNYPANVRVHRRAFRRWLERVKAEAQAEALRGAVRHVDSLNLGAAGMDEVTDWLMRRADRIAREAGLTGKETK